MGFKFDLPTCIILVSTCIGIGLLVTGSLIVDDVGPAQRQCDKASGGKVCENVRIAISAGSLGIIAAILQILTLVCIWMEETGSLTGMNIGTFVLAIIAFALCTHVEFHHGSEHDVAFFAFSLMAWMWCIIAEALLYFFGNKRQ